MLNVWLILGAYRGHKISSLQDKVVKTLSNKILLQFLTKLYHVQLLVSTKINGTLQSIRTMSKSYIFTHFHRFLKGL